MATKKTTTTEAAKRAGPPIDRKARAALLAVGELIAVLPPNLLMSQVKPKQQTALAAIAQLKPRGR